MTVSRRTFLAGSAAGAALTLRADPLGMPIACQVFPVRDGLGKDFDGTLRQLAGLGYKGIEMCSPPSYASSGFGPLVSMKTAEQFSIRAEFFNAFNRLQLPAPSSGSPGSTQVTNAAGVPISGFGYINANSTSGQRNGQLVARFTF